MATTTRVMASVSPAQVLAVLRDGRSYQHWVVGTRAIRAVDDGWPAPGTRIHYTVGYSPLRKDDVTISKAYDPDGRLELEAKAWPAGTVGIVMRVEPEGGGCRVSIDEAPRRGPARLVAPVLDPLVKVRNVETLRRLERQARLR